MSAPAALPPPSLAARSLTVSRGGRVLFTDLSLAVGNPPVLLLTGPNGAGKTSLLLTLAGAIRPASGSVEYRERGATLDLGPHTHLLLTLNAIKPRLSVRENLAFWRAMNGADGSAPEEALERVGLGGLGPIEAGHLSTGQARRLALARLLVSRRTIWLLDEPTSGLDAEGEDLVREMIDAHCGAGGIAVVATHHDLSPGTLGHETLRIAAGHAALAERAL